MSEGIPATNFSASWTRVDQTSDPSFYSRLLDATRAQLLDHARREPGVVFGPLELAPGLRVLDVGCGTGDYLRIMADLVDPGPAVGIDLSVTLIARAQQRTAGDAANLSFRVGDAYDLPFPDASFDRVVATQVLLHLADPWRAVAEMRRVLTPGGMLSIGEWDWDSFCLALTDRDLGRRFTHLLCDQMRNGLIVRELPSQLTLHGFPHIALTPQVRLSRELDAAYQWLVEPATREFVRTGAITPEDGDRLLDDLRERAATGRYFLARTYYSLIATAGAPGMAGGQPRSRAARHNRETSGELSPTPGGPDGKDHPGGCGDAAHHPGDGAAGLSRGERRGGGGSGQGGHGGTGLRELADISWQPGRDRSLPGHRRFHR